MKKSTGILFLWATECWRGRYTAFRRRDEHKFQDPSFPNPIVSIVKPFQVETLDIFNKMKVEGIRDVELLHKLSALFQVGSERPSTPWSIFLYQRYS